MYYVELTLTGGGKQKEWVNLDQTSNMHYSLIDKHTIIVQYGTVLTVEETPREIFGLQARK